MQWSLNQIEKNTVSNKTYSHVVFYDYSCNYLYQKFLFLHMATNYHLVSILFFQPKGLSLAFLVG